MLYTATVENVKDNQPTLRGKEEINSSESKVSVKTLSQDSSSNSSSSSNSTAGRERESISGQKCFKFCLDMDILIM